MNPETTPLKKFYLMLSSHDWQYDYSDDFQVWQAGSRMRTTLENISLESDEHSSLFRKFADYKLRQIGNKPAVPEED